MALEKTISALTETDLQALVTAEIPEGLHLEYKLMLNVDKGDDKREFVNDVSSFANATGGHLIYGIKEKNGIPQSIEGIELKDQDAAILRLEDIIKSSIDPRIPSVKIRAIPLSSGRHCIVIHVGQSWVRPHMVTLGSHKFFARRSAGKYPLDANEIRQVFVASDTFQKKLRDFHFQRLNEIMNDTTSPFKLGEGAKTVLHLIPLSSADSTITFDITKITESIRRKETMFIGSINSSHERYNLEGYQASALTREQYTPGYIQVFRNGTIEGVENWILGALTGLEGKKNIAIVTYEQELIETLPVLLRYQQELGVEPPIFVIASLTGLCEFSIETPHRDHHAPWYKRQNFTIDHDPLVLPEVIIDSFNIDAGRALRPILDALWNASGFPRCPHYDKDGNWQAPRH